MQLLVAEAKHGSDVPGRRTARDQSTHATMEIYTEVPSAATRAALRKPGQWLGS